MSYGCGDCPTAVNTPKPPHSVLHRRRGGVTQHPNNTEGDGGPRSPASPLPSSATSTGSSPLGEGVVTETHTQQEARSCPLLPTPGEVDRYLHLLLRRLAGPWARRGGIYADHSTEGCSTWPSPHPHRRPDLHDGLRPRGILGPWASGPLGSLAATW